MKRVIVAILAALMLAPVTGFADEAPAKPKRKLQLKPQGYVDLTKAKAEAMKYEVPILTIVLLDGDEKSALVKKYLLGSKLFKSFAAANFTVLTLKGKKKGNEVDVAAFRKMREFIEANVMGDAGKEEKPTDPRFYPSVFLMSSDAEKKLAHLPKYNPELGFGAWAMDAVAKLEQGGVTATVPPAVQKAIDDPQPDIKIKSKKK